MLKEFSPPVREWFTGALGVPTRTQEMGWPVLARGDDALVCAPTGTGKTLCAFLLSIDRLLRYAKKDQLNDGVRVLYISPLKALGNDIANNLDIPLEGIAAIDPAAYRIRKMVRTGDTINADRRQMATHPPHILITTPESLYLMLTSKAAKTMFSTVETVIVDEVHALLESKRGTHLALSLERLKGYANFQRIGLTATVEPLSEAADFIGGVQHAVHIVDAREKKAMEVLIECPWTDFHSLPQGTIWPQIASTIYQYTKSARQTLVFCNNRASTENVATGINKEAGIEGFAATHHGSMDKQRRLESEMRFKSGDLRCLCATSSMELGIDIGSVDLVVQVASPMSAARGLQRLGRSGHRPGDTSRMRILPRMPQDALEAALVTRAMLEGKVEPMRLPRLCLDVLAQHIVSMVCAVPMTVEEIYAVATAATPYRDLTRDMLRDVLRMLRGDYEHRAGRDFRPRIYWDEQTDTIHTDSYGRMLACMGSTIPDRGMYPVVTPEGVRVGELEEEFVYEARVGDRFRLGAFPWAITRIQHDRVVVAPTDAAGARIPFWKGDGLGRPSATGEDFGRQLAQLERAENTLDELILHYKMDDAIVRTVAELIDQQMQDIGYLPTDKRVIVEHVRDESGECLIAVHCVLGGRVNQALSMLLRETASRVTGRDAVAYHSDDGVLLHLTGEDIAPSGLLQAIDPATVRQTLLRVLPGTPRFTINFRQAAAVALMIGGRRGTTRVPLWVQRLRGAEALSRAAEARDHPLIIEAYRECMERNMEVDRLIQLLNDIRSGEVSVVEVRPEHLSALTNQLKNMLMGDFTYMEANPADVTARGALVREGAITPEREHMAREASIEVRTPDQLYAHLLRRGSLVQDELENTEVLAQELVVGQRAVWIKHLLCATHEAIALENGLSGDAEALQPFLLRYLTAVGEESADALMSRFGQAAESALEELEDIGELTSYRREPLRYYAPAERARMAVAIAARERRASIVTVPAAGYAALLPHWQKAMGGARLSEAIEPLLGLYQEASQWEKTLFPTRVTGYKPRDLDQLLLTGELIWRIRDGQAAFFPSEQPCLAPKQSDDPVYRALLTDGALFQRQIAQRSGIAGAELDRRLLELAHAGLAVCDGFRPLRAQRAQPSAARDVRARISAQAGEGRWEAAGPIAPMPVDQQLDMLFDRWALVGKECAAFEGIAWAPLLEELRRMEYRDEVRRGYFVRGMSGMQFVRTRQYERVAAALQSPQDTIVLNAADPAQAYGAILPGADFSRLPGTAVVLEKGVPVLVAERRGASLRSLNESSNLTAAIGALADAFLQKRIWPDRLRLTVKSRPEGAEGALRAAGFVPDMLDYTLWR